jgi:hypothetical protein
MQYIKQFELFETEGPHSFGCAMVFFDLPFIEALHTIIDEKDLYTEKDENYGFETEPHTTLLYGLHEEVDSKVVIEYSTPKKFDKIKLLNVSVFKNPKFDVLKMDAEAKWLTEVNKKLTKLPHTNDYPDYHPHATIAYLKKGTAKKYIKMLNGLEIMVVPKQLVFSTAAGKKTKEKIKIEEE